MNKFIQDALIEWNLRYIPPGHTANSNAYWDAVNAKCPFEFKIYNKEPHAKIAEGDISLPIWPYGDSGVRVSADIYALADYKTAVEAAAKVIDRSVRLASGWPVT